MKFFKRLVSLSGFDEEWEFNGSIDEWESSVSYLKDISWEKRSKYEYGFKIPGIGNSRNDVMINATLKEEANTVIVHFRTPASNSRYYILIFIAIIIIGIIISGSDVKIIAFVCIACPVAFTWLYFIRWAQEEYIIDEIFLLARRRKLRFVKHRKPTS